jgi:ubiquinone/menaquinone biosynthesis C-methylase UbiE
LERSFLYDIPLTAGFERLYHETRTLERRLCSDDELRRLPETVLSHPYHDEWKTRKRSSEKLLRYLKSLNKPLNILEAGCGNGWLSARLASIPRTSVTGIDINAVEITQADRVFPQENLQFRYTTFDDFDHGAAGFDVIVFAASIQYFPELDPVLRKALRMLAPGGEIHILDSRFYAEDEAEQSAVRSARYYSSIGVPEMAGHYFHRRLAELRRFDYTLLDNPRSLFNRITRASVFHWIRIVAGPST